MAWPQVREAEVHAWHLGNDSLATGQTSRATGSKVVIQTKGAGDRRHQERKTRERAVMEHHGGWLARRRQTIRETGCSLTVLRN
jgi:hypothetical protein